MTFRFALQYAANNDLGKLDAACAKAAFATWWDTSSNSDLYGEVMENFHD